MERINVTRSSMPSFEEYTNEIKDLFDSHWITNDGVKYCELKEKLQKYLGVSDMVLFSNGHMALENVISAFDLKGEVITTPFTFISTTHAIVRNGLNPVFCDINPKDYTIDADKIESLITENTSAIIPVHVYGNVCDYIKIDSIAKKYNLKVIYDAAHAFGVTSDSVSVANMGDASAFSFHATKVFNTIEGGCAVCKNKEIIKKLNSLKNFGLVNHENIEYIGMNAKMNEFSAAMGICNLRHIEDDIAKRKKVCEQYVNLLGNEDGIKLCEAKENVKSNYAYFPVLFEKKYDRNTVCEKLNSNGIFPRKYFYPLANNNDCYGFFADKTPVAKYVSEHVLTLPLYADLKIDDVKRICDIILNV